MPEWLLSVCSCPHLLYLSRHPSGRFQERRVLQVYFFYVAEGLRSGIASVGLWSEKAPQFTEERAEAQSDFIMYSNSHNPVLDRSGTRAWLSWLLFQGSVCYTPRNNNCTLVPYETKPVDFALRDVKAKASHHPLPPRKYKPGAFLHFLFGCGWSWYLSRKTEGAIHFPL